MYPEEETFAKGENKKCLNIPQQEEDNKNDVSKVELQIFVENGKVSLDFHRNGTVNENVHEHERVKRENECDVRSSDTEISISRIRYQVNKVVCESKAMSGDINILERAGGNTTKQCKTLKKHTIPEMEKDDMENGSRKDTNNKSCVTRIGQQNVKVTKLSAYDSVGTYSIETGESEIDEPEEQEILNTNTWEEAEDKQKDTRNNKQRTFECQTCNEKFLTRWEFKMHLTKHPRGNILQCKDCQKVFSRTSELQNHIRTHTRVRPLQCDVCGMSFSCKNILRKHGHTHATTKEFECEICNKTFSRKQYLQEHKRTHTGSKPYVCDVCHKSFVGKTGLNHHKKTHKSADEKKSAVCDICGKSFTRHALWTHMKHHNKEHKCEFCNKCFATTAALNTHVAGAHLGHSWHHCNTCGKGYIRKTHLSRHMKTHEQGNETVVVACNKCPSKFKDDAHLKAHVKRKHTEQSKSQKCGICGKLFSTQCTLLYHQRLHFHERPHHCNMCGKSFAMPYQLRNHTRRRHSEEKPFSCSVCKRQCATQSSLNKHLLTHRPTFTPKSKPPGSFSCSLCSKTFPTKLALSNHSRTHNFIRPYQCNTCRKAFRYQDSFLKHLRLHPNDPSSETPTAKELPCIYTIQVCRPSFAPINSDIADNLSYDNEQVPNGLRCGVTEANSVTETNRGMCLNAPEKTASEITVLQLKPVEEAYLSHTLLQAEEVEYASLPSIDTSSSICNVPLEKPPDVTSLPRRPYSITIDGNLCCNATVSTDGDITPSITLIPERSDMEISDMDVGVILPSHVILPTTPSDSLIELSELSVPLPSVEVTHEFHGTLNKEFSL